jgi:hypothetical protein
MKEAKKLAEESWEGCDGCTEQDEIMYKNGYVKGYNAASSQTTSERIKEIQQQTAYPESISVQQALLQVWNECSQLPKTTSDKWKEYQDWINNKID